MTHKAMQMHVTHHVRQKYWQYDTCYALTCVKSNMCQMLHGSLVYSGAPLSILSLVPANLRQDEWPRNGLKLAF